MMIGVTELQIAEKWIEVLSEIGYEYVPKDATNWRFLERKMESGYSSFAYLYL